MMPNEFGSLLHNRIGIDSTEGGTVPINARPFAAYFCFGFALLTSMHSLQIHTSAAPYYTVREVSNDFRFPAKTDLLPIPDESLLPGVTVRQGMQYPRMLYYHMQVNSINTEGTVIGTVPDGHSYAIPASILAMGYAVKKEDGTYGDFVRVFDFYDVGWGALYLNNKNQILSTSGQGQEIIDLNAGTRTNLKDLLSADDQSKYPFFDIAGFSDDGSILGIYYSHTGQYSEPHEILISPPTLPLETPVPEPTSMAIFAVAILALIGGGKVKKRNCAS